MENLRKVVGNLRKTELGTPGDENKKSTWREGSLRFKEQSGAILNWTLSEGNGFGPPF